jgi:hypothetical protein
LAKEVKALNVPAQVELMAAMAASGYSIFQNNVANLMFLKPISFKMRADMKVLLVVAQLITRP